MEANPKAPPIAKRDYGVFKGAARQIPDAMRDRLSALLRAAPETAGVPDEERGDILGRLRADLAELRVSSSVRMDESARTFTLSAQEVDWMERQPDSRWIEYLVYRYKFKVYPRLRKLGAFPLHLVIEPASMCNLRCVMCFQVDEAYRKDPMGMIPWELFVSVVDQARAHGCHAITMASRGEPTLHKRFGDMLRYVADSGAMDIKINTNATRLPEKLCHDILAAGVNEVVFSVDSGTKETYEAIRVGGRFEEVVANIERFNAIRARDYPRSPTVTRVSGVLVREDQDPDQMASFWGERADQVTLKKAFPRWDSYANPKSDVARPCSLFWERMYVWYDGVVNPCDFDYRSFLRVGDARAQTLTDIWRGEGYEKLRRDHLAGLRGRHVPCDRCPLC